MTPNIDFYDKQAHTLNGLYNSQSFEAIHDNWLDIVDSLPANSRICDIGAGNGRDAAALIARGHRVYAVEPADAMRKLGMKQAPEATWINDMLPELSQLFLVDAHPYDLVLVSGVWMHLEAQEQAIALQALSELLSNDGKLVILLRRGGFSDGRTTSNPIASDVIQLAKAAGLRCIGNRPSQDNLHRSDVSWSTLIFTL